VVSYTSEEVDYPAEELNAHGPNTKGWQSAKFSSFPQELILELDAGECRLSQIQILSHQSKISSKVEIFVGSGGSPQDALFKRLGYLSLDPNEKSNFQARELKTVYIDNLGKYVKLLVHKNYINQHNYFNQVGIVAVNLIGVEMNANQDHSRRAMPAISNNPINDLALDMNLDPQTTAKLRQLAEAKTRAVATEDYVTAKKIKSVENDLKDLGTRLAQLEIAKRKAVEAEDYDRAKELKDECDAVRDEIEFKVSKAADAISLALYILKISWSILLDQRHQDPRRDRCSQPGTRTIDGAEDLDASSCRGRGAHRSCSIIFC
jgi:centrosomal protein CEP104